MADVQTTMTAITLAQASADLLINIELDIPTLIVGPVGVGKTDIVRQCADTFRNRGQKVLVIDKRASQMDPTDIAVPMPDIHTRKVVACIQEWLPDTATAAQYDIIVLMFDELTDAQLGTQAALNQLVLERELPGYKLPANVRIVATGNTQSDRAAAQKVSRAMSNRFAIILVIVDVDAWLAWANANGICAELIGYVQTSVLQLRGANRDVSEALHMYPTGSGSDAQAFKTPRSLARCDRFFKMATLPNDVQLRRLLMHNVGKATADDIMNFLVTYRLAPSIGAIMADAAHYPVPREPSVNFAIVVGLVSRLTMANLPTVATYVKRMGANYQAVFWSNAIAKDDAFEKTAEHVSHLIASNRADANEAA
jgi:hypothetical protein